MEASWNIAFTQQFKRDVEELVKLGYKSYLTDLDRLKNRLGIDAKKMQGRKSQSAAFRWRKGTLRIIFRLVSETKTVLLIAAGQRKDIYEKKYRNRLKHNQQPAGCLEELMHIVGSDGAASPEPSAEPPTEAISSKEVVEEEEMSIEETLFDEAELFLIGIPDEYHPSILDAASIDELSSLPIPSEVCARLEDYLTAPGTNHIGRIYALGAANSIESIAEQSLRSFLLALDPQQQAIVEQPFDKGPYLIKGGPGTGKTLINLARIRRIREEQLGKDLLNKGLVRIGFITFNKHLSETAEAMYKEICQKDIDPHTEFDNFDSLMHRFAERVAEKAGRRPSNVISWEKDRQASHLNRALRKLEASHKARAEHLMAARGDSFFIEEFNEVILGNGLRNEESYLKHQRKGRKVALKEGDRQLIFILYQKWLQELKESNDTTYEARQLSILGRIEDGYLDLSEDKYDYLFVDELQDLSPVAIRILAQLVKQPANLTLSTDSAQAIYRQSPYWKDVSEDLRFHAHNSFTLEQAYRVTREIDRAIKPLRLNAGDGEGEDKEVSQAVFEGDSPHWLYYPTEDHPGVAALIAQSIIKDKKVNPGQIAIISPTKKLSDLVEKALKELGIAVDQVKENRVVDLSSRAVHLLHAHIAKGLEFPFVIATSVVDGVYPNSFALKRAKSEDQQQEEQEKSRRLLYTVLSRAARELWMISDRARPSQLLMLLDEQDWNTSDW